MITREHDGFLQFGNAETTFWTGVVEDRDDPGFMGRMRVRIFGIHPTDRTEVPTETLPWASVLSPSTNASFGGIGGPAPSFIEGTWVVGFFRDAVSSQDPIIFGALLSNSSPKWTGSSNLLKNGIPNSSIAGNMSSSKNATVEAGVESLNESFVNDISSFTGEVKSKIDDAFKAAMDFLDIKSLDDFFDVRKNPVEAQKQIDAITEPVSEKLASESLSKAFKHYNIQGEVDPTVKEETKAETKADLDAKIKKELIAYQSNKTTE